MFGEPAHARFPLPEALEQAQALGRPGGLEHRRRAIQHRVRNVLLVRWKRVLRRHEAPYSMDPWNLQANSGPATREPG